MSEVHSPVTDRNYKEEQKPINIEEDKHKQEDEDLPTTKIRSKQTSGEANESSLMKVDSSLGMK